MNAFLVTGPEVEFHRAASASVGLSAAITFASRAAKSRLQATYYVRDETDQLVGRADSDGSGSVLVYGSDRASASGPSPSPQGPPMEPLADGRPGPTRRPRREPEMAKTKTSKNARRQAARRKPVARRSSTARTPASDLHAEAKRVSAKQAAMRILKAAGREGLPAGELAQRILRTRGVSLSGKTPEATINAMLSVENGKRDGLFVRVKPGVYALRDARKRAAAA